VYQIHISDKKGKVHPLKKVMKTYRKWRDIALLSILGARLGWVVNATPWRERDPIPIVQENGWAQCCSGQEGKISPLSGFQPRTTHHV
jgi:hypothetical protein